MRYVLPFKKDKNNPLHKFLEALNPLQELDDYNLSDSVKLKKMSTDKLQEYMYGMQKQGELFLQSRTMLALMLKENLIDFVGSDVHHMQHVNSFQNKITIKSEKKLIEAIERNSILK